MKKKVLTIGVIGVLVIILILVILTGDKALDVNSKLIKDLYTYLGEADIYHCGGLNAYSGSKETKDSLDNSNLLCMAYYKVDSKDVKEETEKVTGKNASDTKICKIGDSVTLTAKDDEKECSYKVIDKNKLNEAFKGLYGSDIKDYSEFYITYDEACYLEGDSYYCGKAETFTFSLAKDSEVYRLIAKASKSLNDDIVITDYYLRVSDSKCYLTNGNDSLDNECSAALEKLDKSFINLSDEDKTDFIKKYGKMYKHTFKTENNKDYYWYQSLEK